MPHPFFVPPLRAAKPLAVAAAATLAAAGSAGAVPLLFDMPTTPTTGETSLGPSIETDQVFFTGVATDGGITVDMRVTATAKNDTDFAEAGGDAEFNGDPTNPGYIPDYDSEPGGPEQDLAFVYFGNGVTPPSEITRENEDGITLDFEFFDGTGAKSGTFLDPFAVSALEFVIYDVDGEASQIEFFRATISDGLQSYRVDDDAGGVARIVNENFHTEDEVLFLGNGSNRPEDDPAGAVILSYGETSAFTLDFGAWQVTAPSSNLIFTAFDGDVSLFDPNDFADPVSVAPPPPSAVPLPAAAWLLGAALLALGAAGRRRA